MSTALPVRRHADRRRAGALLTLVLVLAGGFAFQVRDTRSPPRAADAATHAADARAREVRLRFEQGTAMLHARQFEHAMTALHRVLELEPELPEAHVNMGYALLGLKRHREARAFFESATALRPQQANAYYGMALTHEAEGDLAPAIGAMRTYVHLARDESEQHLRRARAALWEWEQQRPKAGR